MSKTNDLLYGKKSECEIIKVLQAQYENVKQTKQNHPFDFIAENTYFELKSRRCNHDTYPDTMIGFNKIQYARQYPDKNYVFLFKFIDGLYKHHFIPEKQYTLRQGGRYDRGQPEIKQYAYIPISDLTLFN
jgi:hypothetical protein